MLKKLILASAVSLSLMSIGSVSAAGDVAAGKARSGMCAGCHGGNGIGIMPIYPNLAGQHAAYTAKQLKAFKDKTRVDLTMNGMAAGLTDADIENISAYYESLK